MRHHPTDPRRLPRLALLALAALLVLQAGAALAAPDPRTGELVPRQIPYRGILEQSGAPVASAVLSMTFELFDAPTGGSLLWSEVQSGVSVQGGRFSALLGEVTPIPAAALAQADLYLAVTVGGQRLEGRQRLLTVPYAHRAAEAWSSNGRDIYTGLVPPGTIVAFAGATPPAGWVLCDGTAYARADLAALFQAIGTAWGAPDGATFRVPDLRGRFLRGVDGGTGRDPEAAARSAPAPGGDAGAQVGSVQGFATSASGLSTRAAGLHNHGARWFPYLGSNTIEYWDNVGSTEANLGTYEPLPTDGNHTHALVGAAETRPVNAAVTYIIKY